MAAKLQRKRLRLAQNFLKSPRVVRRLVSIAAIGPDDTVYEIGPGKGIITAELARVAKRVVAIEKDATLARLLRERFRSAENVEIVETDFLKFTIRPRRYKIFASIPYNTTADIVRKILNAHPTPTAAYLIMQKEAAKKFAGVPHETLFSLLAKPDFEFRILAELRRTDFDPMPNVDSVLLRITRRSGFGDERLRRPNGAFLSKGDAADYRHFVKYAFSRWKRNLRSALKEVFTYKQWKRLAGELGFPLDATPTQLSFVQWLGLFDLLKRLQRGRKVK